MIDFSRVKTYAPKAGALKVNKADFALTPRKKQSFAGFYNSLPGILKGRDLRSLVAALIKAKKARKPIILMCGAHVIKCGLNPVIIELLQKRMISCLSLNGAGIIHDFEIAALGKTSEDVAASLSSGRFGMNRKTAHFINQAIARGAAKGWGIGRALGEAIANEKLAHKKLSIAYQAARTGIPLTVHVAIGTDVIHQHPDFNAALTAEGSLRDFRILVEVVSRMSQGGVLLNFGSAVILPEVFLKALNLARNLGFKVNNFTTANFDMIYQYRPAENIVRRPVLSGGRGYYFIGHHEIMLPLLAQAVIEKIK